MARNYSSLVEPKTLAADITDTAATTITLNNTTGLPATPYVLVINPDTASEEVVLVTSNASSPTLTVTRAIEASNGLGIARTHTFGNVVKHMIVGSDLQIVHDHFSNDDTATGTAHGATGGVVGRTNSQTLTNKTLTSPTITSPTISGTITGAVVTSANIVNGTITGSDIASETITSTNILDGTIVNADINASAAIAASKLSGVVTPTSTDTLTNKTINAADNTLIGTIAQFNTALSDANFATQAGTETLTNKTLTSPTITGSGFDAWQSYTPTLTNVNITGGTSVFAYVQIGKTVHVRGSFTAGAATPISGSIQFSVPVTASTAATGNVVGNVLFTDTGTAAYPGVVRSTSSTVFVLNAMNASGTYTTSVATSSSIPFTWGTGDSFEFTCTYEAA
jgi:hypothetical protein